MSGSECERIMAKKMSKEQQALLLDESRSPSRNILWLAWPIFLENVLSTLVSYADTAMVGSMGAYATASVSISNSVVFLFNGVVMALGIGVTALISQSVGAGDRELTKKLTRQALLILLYIGLPIAVILGVLYRAIPLWMGAEADIIDYAASYNLIVSFGRFFSIASMLVFSAMRGCGDTTTPLRINLGVNIANVIGNFFLIYPTRTKEIFGMAVKIPGAGWGVNGAAAATAVSMTLGGVAAVMLLFVKKDSPMHISIHDDFHIDMAVMKKIFKISFPAMLERICMSGSGVVISRSIAGLGTVAIAANTVYVTTESISFMPGFAFASACTTLVGQAVGAGKKELAERYMRTCVILSIAVMFVAGAALFFFGRYVLVLFSQDQEVLALANRCLRIAALLQPGQTGATVYAGGLRGAGDTLWAMIITTASQWVFRAILGGIICVRILGYGLPAAVTCMLIESYIRFVLFYIRVHKGNWKEGIIEKNKTAKEA